MSCLTKSVDAVIRPRHGSVIEHSISISLRLMASSSDVFIPSKVSHEKGYGERAPRRLVPAFARLVRFQRSTGSFILSF